MLLFTKTFPCHYDILKYDMETEKLSKIAHLSNGHLHSSQCCEEEKSEIREFARKAGIL